MKKIVCVYGASSNAVKTSYFETAHQLGKEIARRKYTLVFGGAEVGLMGAVASSAHKHGAKVVGIVPEVIHKAGLSFQDADKLIVTPDMYQRKKLMAKHSDGFIVLPGGFGTLEEALEIITRKQLGDENKPIVFLNIDRFYHPLMALFEYWYKQNIIKESNRHLYHFARTIDEALDYIEQYKPGKLEKKWF